MTRHPASVADEGTAFQGRVTASVTHELKNVLATISERAGLLGDLVELAEMGRPLDPAKLRRCADVIVSEVRRGFRVVENLNTFAHSSDDPVAEVDLGSVVVLMTGLASYLSYSSTVDLEGLETPGPRVTTRPLLLEDLVYRALVHVFTATGRDGSIAVSAGNTSQGGRIVVSGLAGGVTEGFLDEDVERILEALHGRVEAQGDELHILLPKSIRDTTDE
jgi:signal transduction histidine kinase